ncbi:MAG: conjugal transfer protein TraX [Clostridiales bacterium]|jgi:hypothetical protein|nr:conjugal transfer protein TraX [Clostridiales bacterium]
MDEAVARENTAGGEAPCGGNPENTPKKYKVLSGSVLKYIAIAAMLLDHTAFFFMPSGSVVWQISILIGGMTMPIMCFFIAEGYARTRNFNRYLLRLALFAAVSYLPFALMYGIANGGGHTLTLFGRKLPVEWRALSIIYSLALGLLAVKAYDKINNVVLRDLAVIAVVLLSVLGDWPMAVPPACLLFYTSRKRKYGYAHALICITLLTTLLYVPYTYWYFWYDFKRIFEVLSENWISTAGALLVIPLLSLYNGRRGGFESKAGRAFNKWFFYIFYPLHITVLIVIYALTVAPV